MKKYLVSLLIFAFASSLSAQDKIDRKLVAKTIINLLQNREFEKVRTYMDSSYSKHVTAERLEKQWNSILAKYGSLKKTNEMVENVQANYSLVFLPCVFQNRIINIKYIFNKKDQVIGINFFPEDLKERYKIPSYFDSSRVTERIIRISSGEYNLPGTLSLPKSGKKSPAVILVHGSGPNDRDETVNSTKIFKDIALGLATKGIAVLRFEKRSKMYQVKTFMKEATAREETIDDVIAAYNTLKSDTLIDNTKIFLLGHGFGGMILPRIAKELQDVAGLILIGANAGRLEDLLYDQTAYLLSLDSMTEKKKTMLDSLKLQVTSVKNLTASPENDTSTTRLLFHRKSYWIDLNKYHQVEAAKEIKVPIYIMHGERDYQVTMKDYNAWKTALEQNKNVRFKLYPKLNHLLQEGSGKSTPAEYSKQANVPLYVIDDLYNWMTSKKK